MLIMLVIELVVGEDSGIVGDCFINYDWFVFDIYQVDFDVMCVMVKVIYNGKMYEEVVVFING